MSLRKLVLSLLTAFLLSSCAIQQNSVLNSFGTADGFNCDHVSTRDVEVTTVVTLCRDTWDSDKVVLASANTTANATLSSILSAIGDIGMAVVLPLVAL
jgi:hypothetical protein